MPAPKITINSTTVSIPSRVGAVIDPSPFDLSSIGDTILVEYDVTTSGNFEDTALTPLTIDNTHFWFNPALFIEKGQIWTPRTYFPNQGHYVEIETGFTGIKNVALQGNADAVFANSNTEVEVEVLTPTTFLLRLTFKMTTDVQNFINGRFIKNKDRLLSNAHLNTQKLENGYPSVYSIEKALTSLFAIEIQDIKPVLRNQENHSTNFVSNWYNEDLKGDAELTLFEMSTTAGVVETLSTFEDTVVKVEVTTTSDLVDGVVQIFEYDNNKANQQDWKSDIDFGESDLPEAPVAGTQLVKELYRPSRLFKTGSVITMSVTLQASELDLNKKYYVVFKPTLRTTTGTIEDYTTAYITPIMSTIAPPLPFDLSWEMRTRDYHHDSESNTITVPQERIRDSLIINVDDYNINAALIENYNDFATDFSELRLEVVNSLTDEVYYTDGYIKPVGGTFPPDERQGELNFDFSAPYITFWIQHRNLWYNTQGIANWANETIHFRWTVVMKYQNPSVKVQHKFTGINKVRHYDNDLSVSDQVIEWVKILNPDTGGAVGDLCEHDKVVITAKLHDDFIGNEYILIAFVDIGNGGAPLFSDGNLSEREEASVVTIQPQLQQEPIQLTPEFWDTATGLVTFSLDITGMDEGVNWRVSVLAKPEEPPCPYPMITPDTVLFVDFSDETTYTFSAVGVDYLNEITDLGPKGNNLINTSPVLVEKVQVNTGILVNGLKVGVSWGDGYNPKRSHLRCTLDATYSTPLTYIHVGRNDADLGTNVSSYFDSEPPNRLLAKVLPGYLMYTGVYPHVLPADVAATAGLSAPETRINVFVFDGDNSYLISQGIKYPLNISAGTVDNIILGGDRLYRYNMQGYHCQFLIEEGVPSDNRLNCICNKLSRKWSENNDLWIDI